MSRLPLTVIGGYLGAGKTTLINRLLSADHGLRILVLVNDFGAVNIDAGLLISAEEDTIELANGCVCCTMGADLFMAVGDVLDRKPRPDHLIVEASGIADPARIANVARAEPDLAYAGIVTVVDGKNCEDLVSDTQIGPQVISQITCADLMAVSKSNPTEALRAHLQSFNPTAALAQSDELDCSQILMCGQDMKDAESLPHAAYAKWSHVGEERHTEVTLRVTLSNRPSALFRVKGRVRGYDGEGYLIQAVGPDLTLTRIDQPEKSQLIGIGLASRLTNSACVTWWDAYASMLKESEQA